MAALLALLDRRPQSRLLLSATLWPDTTEARAGASLRATLWKSQGIAPGLFAVDARDVALGRMVRVDLDLLSGTLNQVGDLMSSRDRLARLVTAFLRGDLLAGWDEEWLQHPRLRFRHLRLECLDAIVEGLLEAGRLEESSATARAVLRQEPLRDSTHRLLISAATQSGEAADAAGLYRRAERVLLAHGVPVSPALQRLGQSVALAGAR